MKKNELAATHPFDGSQSCGRILNPDWNKTTRLSTAIPAGGWTCLLKRLNRSESYIRLGQMRMMKTRVRPRGPIGTQADIPWGIRLSKEMDDELVKPGILPPQESGGKEQK